MFNNHALITTLLVVAAIVYAIIDDKVANLIIAAAVVSIVGILFRRAVERRLGDAYDSGKRSERRAIERDLVAFVEKHE
jgi:hypothetical protein